MWWLPTVVMILIKIHGSQKNKHLVLPLVAVDMYGDLRRSVVFELINKYSIIRSDKRNTPASYGRQIDPAI